jgi:hypothetical protein
MGRIVEYEHHGRMVKVDATLKGLHRKHGLCYRCADFKLNQPDACEIAQLVYSNCVEFGITTPVYECPVFKNMRSNGKARTS